MNDRELQAHARQLIDQNVCYSVSGLIYAASQNYEAALKLGFSEDDLATLSWRQPTADDYRDIAPDDVSVTHNPNPRPERGPWDWDWQNGRDCGWGETEAEAWREVFSVAGADEPDGAEIFEHWLVTDWFADKLEAKGESVVRDVLGLTIWGRATTGQAIYIDGVIEEIARDLYAPAPECRTCAEAAETRLAPCDECGTIDEAEGR